MPVLVSVRGDGSLDEPFNGRFHLSEHLFDTRHIHRDDTRDTTLLHRDAVEGIGDLHRPLVVRDDDELRIVLEGVQHSDESLYVGVIEWSIDLVEYAERAGLGLVEREEKGKGGQCAFAAR